MKLCSACLLGVKCRYDRKSKPDKKILELAKKEILIPICPEQLGGLGTPRDICEIKLGKVITKSGIDVGKNFLRGAEETLKIAKLYGIKEAIMKQKSPSCGCGEIYDGNFSGKIVNGDGVTTALLRKNGIKIFSEEDL